MIAPSHTTPLSSYRHNELLREAEQARLVRLARLGRSRRRWQGLHFRIPAIVGRLFTARSSTLAAGTSTPAREDAPTAA